MNINLNSYRDVDEESLAETLIEHHEILSRSGMDLTGQVAILTESNPDLIGTGSAQVWSETTAGTWIYITPDGEVVETRIEM